MLEVQASEENYSFSIYILGIYIIVVQNACWCAVSVQYEENPQYFLLLIEWIKYGWVHDMIGNVKKSWWEVKQGCYLVDPWTWANTSNETFITSWSIFSSAQEKKAKFQFVFRINKLTSSGLLMMLVLRKIRLNFSSHILFLFALCICTWVLYLA
jgi:hypothetical protein